MHYKLAFVIERYFEFGGLQRNMRRFAAACASQGHDVTVFTGRWDGSQEPLLKVETVDLKAWSNHGTLRKMANLVQTLRKHNAFDCIVGFNRVGGLDVYYGGDGCLKAKLQQQHRLWLRFLPRYRTYLKLEWDVFGPNSDAELMLISPGETAKFQNLYKTPSERVHLLGPGIDRDRLTAHPLTGEERRKFREELGVRENELLILTVGSSFHTKGIDRAIGAIAALPETIKKRCRYVVVGLGKEKPFRALAQKTGICDCITFMGGRQDVENFYTAADVLIHPARTENTGNTLLEAMVTGLPVLATENCGYAHYIKEANAGAVCPEPFEQSRLNTELAELLANDVRRRAYGKNGSDYCETADIYTRIEQGVEVILARAEKNRGNAS
ncbi:MAG: glycosyltransferase family 4 protein [Planctomycetota bacterium]